MCDGRKEETHESIKNKIIYTGNGKIDNGYVRFNQRISEVDEMRNFVPQEDDEIIETDATYVIPDLLMCIVMEDTEKTAWMLPQMRLTGWYVRWQPKRESQLTSAQR